MSPRGKPKKKNPELYKKVPEKAEEYTVESHKDTMIRLIAENLDHFPQEDLDLIYDLVKQIRQDQENIESRRKMIKGLIE